MPTREKIILSRLQLYELIWTKPLRTVAADLQMSDVALGKWCRKMEIPRPGRGYWQKLEAGKKVRRTKLRDPDRADDLHVWIKRFAPGEEIPQAEARELPDYEVFENLPANKITVASELERPHPHVARAKKALGKGRVDSQYGWIMPNERPCLDMHVSPGTLDRALRLMDALLKSLEVRAIAAEVRQKDHEKHTTFALLEGERISFGLFESPMKGQRMDTWKKKLVNGMVPSGLLVLRIRSKYGGDVIQFRDKKTTKLEDCLNQFVIHLHHEFASLRRWRVEEAERKVREEKERRAMEELRRSQEAEAAKFRSLELQVTQWRKARDIREFLLAFKEAHSNLPGEADAQGIEWIAWAYKQADRIDPLLPQNK